jgi:hypothetical protein
MRSWLLWRMRLEYDIFRTLGLQTKEILANVGADVMEVLRKQTKMPTMCIWDERALHGWRHHMTGGETELWD